MKIIFVVPGEAPDEIVSKSASDSELYLLIGHAVRDCMRNGLSLPLIAHSAHTTVEECLLALKYFESSNGFKLEALVEEWPWSRITAEMTAMEAEEARCKLALF